MATRSSQSHVDESEAAGDTANQITLDRRHRKSMLLCGTGLLLVYYLALAVGLIVAFVLCLDLELQQEDDVQKQLAKAFQQPVRVWALCQIAFYVCRISSCIRTMVACRYRKFDFLLARILDMLALGVWMAGLYLTWTLHSEATVTPGYRMFLQVCQVLLWVQLATGTLWGTVYCCILSCCCLVLWCAPQSKVAPASEADIKRYLETLKFTQLSPGASPVSDHRDCCSVCLLDYEEGDALGKLHCRHTFHHACIAQWLKRNAVCPMCRQPLKPDCKPSTDHLSEDRSSITTASAPGTVSPPVYNESSQLLLP